MSMNLHLYAEVKATIHTNPPTETVVQHRFDLWQTPSYITYKCIRADFPKDAYIEWLKEQEPEDTYKQPIYAKDDFLWTGPVVGHEDAPTARVLHQQELEEWLEKHKDWKIIWDAR